MGLLSARAPQPSGYGGTSPTRPAVARKHGDALYALLPRALHRVVLIFVFGITGSSSVHLVRPALKSTIGLEGSMRDGPWSYRITSILAVSPIYATLLVTFGTVAGRHRFFARMASNIFGRFLPNAVIRRVADSFAWCFPRSVMK